MNVRASIAENHNSVEHEIDQVVHVPVVCKVVPITLTVLPLCMLTEALVDDKDCHEANVWVVRDVVKTLISDFFVQ